MLAVFFYPWEFWAKGVSWQGKTWRLCFVFDDICARFEQTLDCEKWGVGCDPRGVENGVCVCVCVRTCVCVCVYVCVCVCACVYVESARIGQKDTICAATHVTQIVYHSTVERQEFGEMFVCICPHKQLNWMVCKILSFGNQDFVRAGK